VSEPLEYCATESLAAAQPAVCDCASCEINLPCGCASCEINSRASQPWRDILRGTDALLWLEAARDG
jgi:hypothetical protein